MLCRKLYTSSLPKVPHFHKFVKACKIHYYFNSAIFSIQRGSVPSFDQNLNRHFWWHPSYCDHILVTLWKSNALVHVSSKKNPSWWLSDDWVTTEEGFVRRALKILLAEGQSKARHWNKHPGQTQNSWQSWFVTEQSCTGTFKQRKLIQGLKCRQSISKLTWKDYHHCA